MMLCGADGKLGVGSSQSTRRRSHSAAGCPLPDLTIPAYRPAARPPMSPARSLAFARPNLFSPPPPSLGVVLSLSLITPRPVRSARYSHYLFSKLTRSQLLRVLDYSTQNWPHRFIAAAGLVWCVFWGLNRPAFIYVYVCISPEISIAR